ncbi:hypothetical protein [Microbispora sp. NPDC049125]|uniref:hypothetical protein n=1 Tax=Microbispora sp. NPDC049125 TaxID=3154929 RepID=UPI00346716C2
MSHLDDTASPPALDELIAALRTQLTTLAVADPAAALRAAAQIESLGRRSAEQAAVTAYRRGASWSDIGVAFGISKQAAHQRFARHVRAAQR